MKRILTILLFLACLAPAWGQQGMLLVGDELGEIEDRVLWLRPEVGITVSSGEVTEWEDVTSGMIYIALTDEPDYPGATLNGYIGINFNGSDEGLKNDNIIQFVNSSNGEWTVFAVATPAIATASTLSIFDSDAGGGNRIAQFLRSSTVANSIAFYSGGSSITDIGNSVTATTPYVYHAVCSTTSLEAFLNAQTNGSTAISGGLKTSPYRTSIGARLGGTARFSGDIYEIMAYSRALSNEEVGVILNYLNRKYQLY